MDIKTTHILAIITILELVITKEINNSIGLWIGYGVYKLLTSEY